MAISKRFADVRSQQSVKTDASINSELTVRILTNPQLSVTSYPDLRCSLSKLLKTFNLLDVLGIKKPTCNWYNRLTGCSSTSKFRVINNLTNLVLMEWQQIGWDKMRFYINKRSSKRWKWHLNFITHRMKGLPGSPWGLINDLSICMRRSLAIRRARGLNERF